MTTKRTDRALDYERLTALLDALLLSEEAARTEGLCAFMFVPVTDDEVPRA